MEERAKNQAAVSKLVAEFKRMDSEEKTERIAAIIRAANGGDATAKRRLRDLMAQMSGKERQDCLKGFEHCCLLYDGTGH